MDFRKIKGTIILAAACAVFPSCTKTIGYSVVLWGDESNGLEDGDIVKVIVKSNITHSYIIELPDGQGNKEIPIWQVSEPEGKKSALRMAAAYADFANKYAEVKLDGLPIRAEPVNTAKQVYRLRAKEIIRVLYKGKGAAVSNGKGTIEGEWYRVLTADGTQGWCFSHNLDIYDSETGGRREKAASEKKGETDKLLQILRGKKWVPAEYEDLIKAKRIDLDRFDEQYGFTFDEQTGKLSILTADGQNEQTFTKIRKITGKQYRFEGASVTATINGDDDITVQYMDNGKPKNVKFSTTKEDIPALIKNERSRRIREIQKIAGFGPTFSSSNYGTLTITPANGSFSFTWQNTKLLSDSKIIESGARGSGTVSVKYYLSKQLQSSYDGILTFRFDGSASENNFIYKMTETGIRLEDAGGASIKNNVVNSRGQSPAVIFLEKR